MHVHTSRPAIAHRWRSVAPKRWISAARMPAAGGRRLLAGVGAAPGRLRRRYRWWLSRRQLANRQRSAPVASYRYLAHAIHRRERYLRHAYAQVHPVWTSNAKPAGRKLAAALGITVPTLLAEVNVLDDLDMAKLPDGFVIKPVHGTAGRGCFVVQRHQTGFRLLTTGEVLEEEHIRRRFARQVAAGKISAAAIVEELLTVPELPGASAPDWRVFCFGEHIGLVVERVVGPGRSGQSSTRYRYWDEHWNDVGAVRLQGRVDPTLPPPHHPELLQAAARAISGHFRRPHLRVDLFDLPDGVVFGELTPNPSQGKVFTPPVDQRLGQLWEQAEADIFFRGTDQGGRADIRPSKTINTRPLLPKS